MKSIVEKFSISPDFSVLEGGQGMAVKSGNLVIKAVPEREEYEWYSEIFEKHHP